MHILGAVFRVTARLVTANLHEVISQKVEDGPWKPKDKNVTLIQITLTSTIGLIVYCGNRPDCLGSVPKSQEITFEAQD
jgi:hypothetical protein